MLPLHNRETTVDKVRANPIRVNPVSPPTLDAEYWREVFTTLRAHLSSSDLPSVSEIAREKATPYRVLVSTMISLRTKDEVTTPASQRLLRRAPSPEQLARMRVATIAELIYPAGFYRTKADHLKTMADILIRSHAGRVPDTLEQLLQLPGVGRKTANLVLNLGFGIPAICVDTHVHRISNRMGWVTTRTPEQTEHALTALLPKRYWIPINEFFVGFGKRTCTPLSPYCSDCPLYDCCTRTGVTRHR